MIIFLGFIAFASCYGQIYGNHYQEDAVTDTQEVKGYDTAGIPDKIQICYPSISGNECYYGIFYLNISGNEYSKQKYAGLVAPIFQVMNNVNNAGFFLPHYFK